MRHKRSVIGVSLAVLIAIQTGCATKVAPPLRPSDELRNSLGSVAVVAAQLPLEQEISRPVPGKALSAAVGMTGGFGIGLVSAVGCFVTLGYAVPLCGIAIWTPVMMGTGIAEGIDKGMSIDEWKRSTAAIEKVLAEPGLEERLRDAVWMATAEQVPEQLMDPSLEAGSAAGGVNYAQLREKGVDTVLEVAVLMIALARASDATRPTEYGPAPSWEETFHPSVNLTMKARVRLLRAADGTVLFTGTFSEGTGSRTFGEWARDDAAALREARDATLERLARQIAEAVLPPAPEAASPPQGEPGEPK